MMREPGVSNAPDFGLSRDACAVVDALYGAGAKSVWLFGSRTVGRQDRSSDVDLAVEGLVAPSAMIHRLHRQTRERIDIVCMEAAPAALRSEIIRSRYLLPREMAAAPRRVPLPGTLHGLRTRNVAALVRSRRPRSLIDFGCGSGLLLAELAGDAYLDRITGVDLSVASLGAARRRIAKSVGRISAACRRVELFEGLITFRDPRFVGHEAALAVEVIEHLEAPQVQAFAQVMFGFVQPVLAVVTTPNSEYNTRWFQDSHRRRHSDHRFEWSRQEFERWCRSVAASHGYRVDLKGIGEPDAHYGAPSQLAIFER